MPGALTAHTEPNPSTCRRVVAAGIPLPAMRYTTADNHSGLMAALRIVAYMIGGSLVARSWWPRPLADNDVSGGRRGRVPTRSHDREIACRLGVYLCARWNAHSRVLRQAGDRRTAFSIVLVGNQIAEYFALALGCFVGLGRADRPVRNGRAACAASTSGANVRCAVAGPGSFRS